MGFLLGLVSGHLNGQPLVEAIRCNAAHTFFRLVMNEALEIRLHAAPPEHSKPTEILKLNEVEVGQASQLPRCFERRGPGKSTDRALYLPTFSHLVSEY